MNSEHLAKYMMARDSGPWELLATAAGHPDCVARTVSCVDTPALMAGVGGPAGSPSLVQSRVRALAVNNVKLLAEISSHWIRPCNMSRDIMDSSNDMLFSAWLASMRHLVAEKAVTQDELQTDLVGLADEVKICFGIADWRWTDWASFVADVSSGRITHAHMRALDERTITLPTIDTNELRDLVTCGTSGSPSLGRLRIFRGREDKLTGKATAYLCGLLGDMLRTNAQYLSDWEFRVALELAIPRCPSLHIEAINRTIALLDGGADPQDYALGCYVLLQSGWTLP